MGRDLHDKNMNLMREMFKKAGAGQKDLLKVPEVKVLPRQIELAEKLNKDAPERLNPVGVFKRTMQDLDLLKAEKRIDAATADFAGRDAFESLTKMMGEGARRPSAIDYGSREAAKLEASAFGGGGEMNVEETLRAILKETERQTKQNEEANREFRRVLGLFGTKVVIPSN